MNKQILSILLLACILFASCSEKKTFTNQDGSRFIAQPYGWASTEDKIQGVEYKLNVPDVVLSVILSETIVCPIIITAFDVYEPVSYTEPKQTE